MLNNVQIQGRIGNEIEIRVTKNMHRFARMSLAVGRDLNSDGVDWINIIAWDNLADIASKYFAKGDMAIISGRLVNNRYTNKNGNEIDEIEVVANKIYFCGSKQNYMTNTGALVADDTNDDEDYVQNEDLPF